MKDYLMGYPPALDAIPLVIPILHPANRMVMGYYIDDGVSDNAYPLGTPRRAISPAKPQSRPAPTYADLVPTGGRCATAADLRGIGDMRNDHFSRLRDALVSFDATVAQCGGGYGTQARSKA